MRENNNQYENSKKITSKKITRDLYGYPPASALDKGITVDIYRRTIRDSPRRGTKKEGKK